MFSLVSKEQPTICVYAKHDVVVVVLIVSVLVRVAVVVVVAVGVVDNGTAAVCTRGCTALGHFGPGIRRGAGVHVETCFSYHLYGLIG